MLPAENFQRAAAIQGRPPEVEALHLDRARLKPSELSVYSRFIRYARVMSWIAGVDGCRAGWFRVCCNTKSGEIVFDVVASVEDLVDRAPAPAIVAIDIPIGLPDSGSRDCDRLARECLGVRRSSVFRAPIRPAIDATSRAEADHITRQADGKGVSAQSWGIYGKVRLVDDALHRRRSLRAVFHEVHPEVCFWAWNGREPMKSSKKKADGRCERLALAEDWLGEGVMARARGNRLKKHLADDDILDAIAALWTAHRIASGEAERLPSPPPMDQDLLPMQIVF